MAVTAVDEPPPTASKTDGAEPGGSAPQLTTAGETPGSSVQENGEGPANATGESLPRQAAQEPSENGVGHSSDDAEGAAATSPTSDVASATNAVPLNQDAAGVGGDGNAGEDENKSPGGVDQPNLELEGSPASKGEYHRDGGKPIVLAAGPASTPQEDGQSKEEAPVRTKTSVLC